MRPIKSFFRKWFKPSIEDEIDLATRDQTRKLIAAELALISAQSSVERERKVLRFLKSGRF